MKAVAFLLSVRLLNRQLSLLVSNDVAYWPFATNFSSGLDVSFRGEAEVGRAAEFAASVENDPTATLSVRSQPSPKRRLNPIQ